MNSINNWNEIEVNRAKNTWGTTYPPHIKEMYNFAIKGMNSWLDLGCGFGRFFSYLLKNVEDPSYIGYDSSPSMLEQFSKNFPEFSPLVFNKNITSEICHRQNAIICGAVLIHLTLKDQEKILRNIFNIKPKKVAFDINCMPNIQHVERIIKGSRGSFRMTWQSQSNMTKQLMSMFRDYKITTQAHLISKGKYKTIYLMEKI